MTDNNAQFHFSIARITAAQIMRAAGIDRASCSVVDTLADLLVRMLDLLALEAMQAANHAGRPRADLQDVRLTMEQAGLLRESGRNLSHEEHMQEAVLSFGRWITGEQAQGMRRIAGEGEDDLGEATSSDWLTHLLQKNVRVAGEDAYQDSVLADLAKRVASEATEQTTDAPTSLPRPVRKSRKLAHDTRAPVDGLDAVTRIPREVQLFTTEHASV